MLSVKVQECFNSYLGQQMVLTRSELVKGNALCHSRKPEELGDDSARLRTTIARLLGDQSLSGISTQVSWLFF